mgnify:CR=1 FL=1
MYCPEHGSHMEKVSEDAKQVIYHCGGSNHDWAYVRKSGILAPYAPRQA